MRMILRAYPDTTRCKSVAIKYYRGEWTVIRCDLHGCVNITQIERKYAPSYTYKEMVKYCYGDVLNNI